MRRAPCLLGTVALLGAIAGCSDLSIDLVIDRITTPIPSPSFSRDIAPILAESCASSGACHGGSAPRNGLDLTEGRAYASLFNVNATVFKPPALYRVRPNFPDSSLFFGVLTDTSASRLAYYRMPLTRFPLPTPAVETIRNWINNGAPNN